MAYTLWTRHLNFNPQSKDFLIDLFYQQVMVRLYCIAYYMSLVV